MQCTRPRGSLGSRLSTSLQHSSAVRTHPLRPSTLMCLNMASKKGRFSAAQPSMRALPPVSPATRVGCQATSRAYSARSSISVDRAASLV